MADETAAELDRGVRSWVRHTLDTRRGGASHVDALDGLRGVAVAFVFFVHYQPWVAPYLPGESAMRELGARVADVGNIGVDLFFVLSGFLIYGGLLRRPQPFGAFMQRRMQRLYPTFIVVFVPVLLIEIARGAPTLRAGSGPIVNLLGNLTLVAGFLPIDPLIVVAWTLSWEVAFYILTPAVFRFARLRERSAAQRLGIVAVVWGALTLSGALRGVGNARLIMFLGGVVVAEWVAADGGRNVAARRGLRIAAAVAAVVVPVACFALTYGGTLHDDKIGYGNQGWAAWTRIALLLVTMPLIVAAVVDGRGALARFMSWTPLRWLGIVSYSYYLIHALVIRFLGEAAQHVAAPADHRAAAWWLVALAPTFVATLVASFVLFAAVERPCSLDRDPPVTVLPPRILRWPWQRGASVSPR